MAFNINRLNATKIGFIYLLFCLGLVVPFFSKYLSEFNSVTRVIPDLIKSLLLSTGELPIFISFRLSFCLF